MLARASGAGHIFSNQGWGAIMRLVSEKCKSELKSLVGPTIPVVRVVWAAHVTTVVPPIQARKILKRTGNAA